MAAGTRIGAERRDPKFKQKMAEVPCVYREVKLIKEKAATATAPILDSTTYTYERAINYGC